MSKKTHFCSAPIYYDFIHKNTKYTHLQDNFLFKPLVDEHFSILYICSALKLYFKRSCLYTHEKVVRVTSVCTV